MKHVFQKMDLLYNLTLNYLIYYLKSLKQMERELKLLRNKNKINKIVQLSNILIV